MISSHKPSFLKDIKGISLRKESAELNTANQFRTKYFPLLATRCVPHTTQMKRKIYFCGDGHNYLKQQKGVHLCFYRRYMQTANNFHSYFKL